MVAIDLAESAGLVKKYRDKHNITYPILLDPDQSIFSKIMGRATPWNIVVDQKGIIRYSVGGFSPGAIKSVVDGLLQGQAKS